MEIAQADITYGRKRPESDDDSDSHVPKRRHVDVGARGAFVCYICNNTYEHKKTLLKHQRTKHDPDSVRFQCTVCGRSFTQDWDRRRHESEQHGEGKQPCERCQRLVRPDALQEHQKTRACVLTTTRRTDQIDKPATPSAVAEDDNALDLTRSPSSNGEQSSLNDSGVYMDRLEISFVEEDAIVTDSGNVTSLPGGELPPPDTATSARSVRRAVTSFSASGNDAQCSTVQHDICSMADYPASVSDEGWEDIMSMIDGWIPSAWRNDMSLEPDKNENMRDSLTRRPSDVASRAAKSILKKRILGLRLSKHSQVQRGITSSSVDNNNYGCCTLCGQLYGQTEQEVRSHVTPHLTELKDPRYSCRECHIDFAYDKDLHLHQAAAEEGQCGHVFQHSDPCSGHHPPTDSPILDTITDHDKLLNSLRSWEYSQLRLLILAAATASKARLSELQAPGSQRRPASINVYLHDISKRLSTSSLASFVTNASALTAPAGSDMRTMQQAM